MLAGKRPHSAVRQEMICARPEAACRERAPGRIGRGRECL